MVARKKTDTSGVNLEDNAPDGIAVSDSEAADARHEGALEDIKETAKDIHRSLTDGNLPGDPPQNPYHGHDEIQQYAHLLGQGVDQFEETVSFDAKNPSYVPDEKVYGLLALERNGQNRTEYVKTMMKRLKLKGDQLPGGGPDYTNDQSRISKL